MFENVAFFGDLLIRMHDIVRQVSVVTEYPVFILLVQSIDLQQEHGVASCFEMECGIL